MVTSKGDYMISTFIAYLPKTKGALKIDGDNQSEIKLIASADQLPEVLKLTMLSGKAFKVMIEEMDKEDKNNAI